MSFSRFNVTITGRNMRAPRTESSSSLGALTGLLDRELATLRREVEAYPDERDLWREVPGIANVGGTLVLHLAGNIQHYLGACLARTGYVRDRPAEFTRRNVTRAELLREVDAARAAVNQTAARVSDEQMNADFPELISGARVGTTHYLMHLTTHLAYHLGQLDYHRRVVTGQNASVDAVRAPGTSSARPAGKR
jgi:uncharacterized damage-inducible protein DinB